MARCRQSFEHAQGRRGESFDTLENAPCLGFVRLGAAPSGATYPSTDVYVIPRALSKE
jgi:hypothetical protein